MAGFAVVVRRSGAPVPVTVVDAMYDALTHRAPEGIDVTLLDNIAVVAGRLHSTPEAHLEHQPVVLPDGSRLVADARLDNRPELAERVAWPRPLAATPDVDLLAACYSRQGAAAAAGLLGDFATVVVEPDGRVVCMRDQLGVKQLYYWIGDDWIVLSSELRQIAAHPEAPRDLDAGVLGQHLSGQVETTTGTVRRGVHRVPAAHTMMIAPGGSVVLRRYWTPPFDERIELAGPDEYAERFLELLTEAVRCRLRTAGPVGCELSGGLDSTSVTALSTRLTAAGQVDADKAFAFSCVFPWSRRADERKWIAQAVEHIGVDWTPIVDPPERETWIWDDAAFWSDIPLPADGLDHVRLCQEARARGCAVVLTGHGGDHSFDPTPFLIPEYLEDWRLRDAWRMTAALRASGLRARLGTVLHNSRWSGLRRRPPRAPAVIGTARAEAGLDERPIPGRLLRSYRSPRAQGSYEMFDGGYSAMSMGIFDRTAARAGVEYRHPYFDRRLVEFGCCVPIDVHDTIDQNRCLQRAGLRGLLPPGILARTSKARFTEIVLRDIEGHLPDDAMPNSEIVRNGWIDLTRALAAKEHTRTAVASPMGAGAVQLLWGMAQVEAVVRAIGSRRGNSDS